MLWRREEKLNWGYRGGWGQCRLNPHHLVISRGSGTIFSVPGRGEHHRTQWPGRLAQKRLAMLEEEHRQLLGVGFERRKSGEPSSQPQTRPPKARTGDINPSSAEKGPGAGGMGYFGGHWQRRRFETFVTQELVWKAGIPSECYCFKAQEVSVVSELCPSPNCVLNY